MPTPEQIMKVKLELEAKKLESDLKRVEGKLHELGGGTGKGVASIQKGFKGAASEASNFVAILTGNKLTGMTSQLTAMGGALGAIPGPAGLAAGALVGVTAATIGSIAALYGLTKAASDYGSQIHDISQQTGLGAETISSLKIAADQSSGSIEQFEKGLAKFDKTVGAAAQGSKEAALNLKALGIDPQAALKDLDGSLGRVFKRIAEAKPGIEQTTLAQKAFGKSGADLIPTIMSFDGDLPGLIKHMKELGVTMTDADAAAADEFGDQMDMLGAQIKGVERVIGMELMPTFRGMASEVSDWLVHNKGTVEWWAGAINAALKGVIWQWRMYAWAIRMAAEAQKIQTGGIPMFEAPPSLDVGTGTGGTGMVKSGGGGRGVRGYDPSAFPEGEKGGGHKPPKESDAEFRKFFDELGFHVVRTFGDALNAKSPHTYGGAADVSIRGKSMSDIFTLMMKSLEKGYRVVDERVPIPGIKQTGPHVHVENAKTSLRKESIFGSKGFGPGELEYLKKLDQERLGKATGMGGYEQFTKKKSDDEIKAAEDVARRKVEIGQTMTESLIDLAQHEYEKNLELNDPASAIASAQQVHDLKVGMIQDEIIALDEQYNRAEIGSKEEADAFHKLSIAKIKQTSEEQKAADDLAAAVKRVADKEKQLHDERRKRWSEHVKYLEHIQDLIDEEADRAAKEQALIKRQQAESHSVMGGHGLGAGIAGGMGISLPSIWDETNNQLKTQAEVMKAIYGDIADYAGGAIGSMVDGLAQLGVNWLMTGEFSAQAALKMLAASAMHIAVESAFKGIFELAEAAAALARFDPVSAALHKVAAGIYFKTAAIAGAVGVGAALFGRATGGGSGAGVSSGGGQGQGAYGGSGRQEPLSPYSRASEDAYISGRRPHDMAVARAIEKLTAKIEGMNPGDVLVAGSRAKRGFIGQTVVNDVKSNARTGRDLLAAAGVR